MYNKKPIISACILIISLVMLTATFAGASAIQDRMKARIPELTELKNSGIVGENNKGYLEFLGAKKDKQNLVNAENADRKKVYTAIGRKQKVDAGVVGSRRAKQLSEKGVNGHWYQNEAGKWSQK